jgi:hypothetical protein
MIYLFMVFSIYSGRFFFDLQEQRIVFAAGDI